MSAAEFTFRRPRHEDVDIAAEILAAEERSLRGESRQGIDEISDWWRLFNLEEGSWIVETQAGDRVAFSGLIEGQDHYPTWVVVHPSFTGRGLATELLVGTLLAERARELAADAAVPIDQRAVAVERRPTVPGHAASLARGSQPSKRFRTTHALWPPKPNEFDTATRTSASRDSFGM